MSVERNIKTAEEFVSDIRAKIATTSSTLNDFSPGSDLMAIINSVVNLAEFLQIELNKGFLAFRIKGARGQDLINRGADYNLTKKEAVAASGIITFTRDTPADADFTISAGAQVSIQPDVFGDTVDFLVDENITFSSGALTATGIVTCTIAGVIGNVPADTITNISSTISGIDEVNNDAAFTNGAEEETDDEYRKRIPVHIAGLAKANESSIKAAVSALDGITIVDVRENTPVAGTVTIYVSNQSGVLTDEEKAAALAAADAVAAFGITVLISTPTIEYVTISMDVTYDSDNFIESVIEENIKDLINTFVNTNSESTLKLWDLMLLIRDISGVSNVKNVKINGVADDYSVAGFVVMKIANQSTSITINFTEE